MLDLQTTKIGLELLSGAVAAIKGIIGLANTATDLEIKRKTDDALEKISEAKQKYFELQERSFDLARQNRELKDEIDKAYEFHHSVNWRKLDDGTEDGPFCPVCLAAEKLELPLQYAGSTQDGDVLFECAIQHRPKGDGTRAGRCYKLPKALIRQNRYVEWI